MNGENAENQDAGPLPPPMRVVVRGLYTGTNVVKWKAPCRMYVGCEFIVELLSADGEWVKLGQVNDRKYNHMDQTPGVPITYRVTTINAGRQSAPSEAVSVYATRDWVRRTDRPAQFRFTLDVARGT